MKSSTNLYKSRCLFLWLDSKNFFAQQASERDIDVSQVYKQAPYILRAIRRIQIELKIPYISFWISSWKKEITKYDTIIIHASKIIVPVVKYIKSKNSNARIIVWYWNPVDKTVPIESYSDDYCEKWSFDEGDCIKYGLKYNTQYYFNNIQLPKYKNKYDVFFFGRDKGRIEKLINIQTILIENGIKTYFHITKTKGTIRKFKDICKPMLSYKKILDYISESKAILDYVSEGQSGLTTRPLEALFFRKKLITNDTTMMDRDFYRKENIFVLGKDSIENLPQFLNIPYQVLEEKIVNKYDFDSWLERFFEENKKIEA